MTSPLHNLISSKTNPLHKSLFLICTVSSEEGKTLRKNNYALCECVYMCVCVCVCVCERQAGLALFRACSLLCSAHVPLCSVPLMFLFVPCMFLSALFRACSLFCSAHVLCAVRRMFSPLF